jgi:V/A-type H+/Na+-transporting ATPase subunit E
MQENTMQADTKTPAGVQSLIERIRDQGVQAAQQEADRVLAAAKKQAADIVAQAKAEADAERAKARAEIEAHRTASLDALQLAARDAVLDLKAQVINRFEQFVKRAVVSATRNEQLIRNIVLVLAGHAADEFIRDKEIEVRISKSLLGEATLEEDGRQAILGLSSDMLREGIQLMPDDEVEGGARVRLVKDKLEIDLSDRAVARLICQRMVPRFKAIVEGAQ